MSTPGEATAPPSPRVAVVVASRDRPALLADCLSALKAALRPGDEAVVVDSASLSGETAAVATAAGFRVVRCERPGASRARNAGLAATTAPIVAFTDDDCLVSGNWTAAVETALADPGLGFLWGAVGADRDEGPRLSAEVADTPERVSGPRDPHRMGHGASMAFRREALRAVGGFDERLGAGVPLGGSEEKDLFWRLLRAGWTGGYEPGAVVIHRQWRGRRKVARTHLAYGLGAGAFAAKVVRLDGRPGWRMLADRVWANGLRAAGRAARAGYEQGVLDSLAFAAGVVLGATRGAFIPLDGGRFRS